MMLKGKNAVIYGAGGSMAGAVAKALAAAGAHLFLSGRNLHSVQKVAEQVIAAGGSADIAEVDAFDQFAVQRHLDSVIRQSGAVDISFNGIGIDVVQGVPLVDIAPELFAGPVYQTLQTRFITATAAARAMIKQGSGVILSLTATPGGIGYPFTGGFAPACAAVECFSTNLAAEVGRYGVRVVNIRSGGSPDSRVFAEAIAEKPDVMAAVLGQMKADTMLNEMPLMADIANVAVFLCSHMAAKITGVTVDVTSGTTAALNYRAAP